jgi:hypothetical protein
MDKLRPVDELAGLRQFLERLESGYVRLRRNQVDVTRSEIGILKREISPFGADPRLRQVFRSKCAFSSN